MTSMLCVYGGFYLHAAALNLGYGIIVRWKENIF
jgi:hypothetical protein